MTIGHILTVVSILVAAGLGLLGFVYNHKTRQRALTVELLGHFSINDRIASANFTMSKLINEKEVLNGSEIEDDVDQHVLDLLNYYEFLATSYQQGALDKDVITHVRGGAMSRAFDVCAQYIEDRRRSLDAPNLYQNYEKFVTDFRCKSKMFGVSLRWFSVVVLQSRPLLVE